MGRFSALLAATAPTGSWVEVGTSGSYWTRASSSRSPRFCNWTSIIEAERAATWALYWRAEIQGYIHAYRAITAARGRFAGMGGIYLSPVPPLDYARHLFYERTLRSVTANTRRDGEELLRIAAAIPIRPHTVPFALADANRALQQLKHDGFERRGGCTCSAAGWSPEGAARAGLDARFPCQR